MKHLHPVAQEIVDTVGTDGHVIWDWNGTLLNDATLTVKTINSLLTEHELPLVTHESYRQIFDFPVAKYYNTLGFDYSKESFESICERFVARFMEGVWHMPLVDGMEDTLRALKGAGLRQSVLSAASQVDLDPMIPHFRLDGIFSAVYGIKDRLAASKIDRGHELMAISPVPREKTVMIGDTLHDLEVAQALGIHAILVGHGHQCPTRLRPVHHKVIG